VKKRPTQTSLILDRLRSYESRNVTYLERDGSWPIVWERSKGMHVWDAEGKRYLDLTAAFGVAAAGHANPQVVRAGQRQLARLPHAMGDVHPHALKAELARDLSRLTFERWTAPKVETGKSVFCNSGFEAVEVALKTAILATGRRGVIAFTGAYHGLGYGTLNATHRDHFRGPFQSQLGEFGRFVPFPAHDSDLEATTSAVRDALETGEIGAVLVEPVQARGGINLPPPGFLPALRKLCNELGALLILDEIYTGFGRTGKWFACEHSGAVPDLICLGKALTGGFPLSVCVGRAEVMDAAWPESQGEAIHTSTFLGNPVGCAMALAQIAAIRSGKLIAKSARVGAFFLKQLMEIHFPAVVFAQPRGIGLMLGIELRHTDGSPATSTALGIIKGMLRRGFILLPEGEHGNVISFTPPLTITIAQVEEALAAFEDEVKGRGI
jgi:4-aminobutyrate aminotransferase-like enzyme